MLYQNLKSYFNKKKKQWIVKRRVIEFKKKFIRLQKEKNEGKRKHSLNSASQ